MNILKILNINFLGVIRVVPDTIKKILNPWIPDSPKGSKSSLFLNEKNNLVGGNTKNSLRGDKKKEDSIQEFGKISPAKFPPWGLDRIDQKNLPLNKNYSAHFTGKDVDVYVIDTGLDTNHDAFKQIEGGHVRTVKNLFSYYSKNPMNPGTDTDGQGHGTHVAGTIGGNLIGVAPNVNIYSLKVLNDDGQGTSSAILAAFDVVVSTVKKNGRRGVVSMSLGGPCESDDCSEDSLVRGVAGLTLKNIIVSVAAGNEGCNACKGSPNAAPSAVNVGATDIDDNVAFFSDIGSCIDILAPGYNILSACAEYQCQSESQYVELSGTSMACPHVTGVIAQLLEKIPNGTNIDINKALSCDSSKNILKMDKKDSITRNLLLQIPKFSEEDLTCDLGAGCLSDCSGSGMCLPVRIDPITTVPLLEPSMAPSSTPLISTSSTTSTSTSTSTLVTTQSNSIQTTSLLSSSAAATSSNSFLTSYLSLSQNDITTTPSNSLYCHCDTGTYGPTCVLTEPPMCISSSIILDLSLYASYGEGWTFANFALTNSETGMIVDGAFDSMCSGAQDSRSYCVVPGIVQLIHQYIIIIFDFS